MNSVAANQLTAPHVIAENASSSIEESSFEEPRSLRNPETEEGVSPKTKAIVRDVVKGAFATGIGFGAGCLGGKIVKGPVIITGVITAVAGLATYIFELAAKLLASKFGWNLSTVNFAKAITGIVMAVAAAVTTFAIGIIGPVGLGVAIGLGLAFSAIPLGFGFSAIFGGKDMPFNEAVKAKSAYHKLSVALAT